MNTSFAPNARAMLEIDDNFCRRCGAAVGARLPAVRGQLSPAIWKPQVPRIVKGAAVMAAGTVGSTSMRRVITNVLSGGSDRAAASG